MWIDVGKASPIISWTPIRIVYGTALGAAQLNATANTAGAFIHSPAIGAILPAGIRALSVTFVPTDSSNYVTVGASADLIVDCVPLIVQADNSAKVFGQPSPAFTAAISGFVAGDSPASLMGVLDFSTSATQYSLPGYYAVVPGGVNSPNYAISFVSGTLTIANASSTIVLALTPNPSAKGQTVQLAATVVAVPPGAGTPSGTVQFRSNGTVLGTVGLLNGMATLNTSFSRKGTYSITVNYSGDGSFTGSTASGTHQAK